MYWVDLPIYLITEGCCHIDYSERNKVGRECTSGLQPIFRITILMRLREELTSHVVAMEKLLPPVSPWFMVISFIVLFCFGRAELSEMVLQSTIGIST